MSQNNSGVKNADDVVHCAINFLKVPVLSNIQETKTPGIEFNQVHVPVGSVDMGEGGNGNAELTRNEHKTDTTRYEVPQQQQEKDPPVTSDDQHGRTSRVSFSCVYILICLKQVQYFVLIRQSFAVVHYKAQGD